MNVTQKKAYTDYDSYTALDLTPEAIDYALSDALVLKQAHTRKACVPTNDRVVTFGMCSYIVPQSMTGFFNSDETYCRKAQVITFGELSSLIEQSTGYPVDIVDCGSGAELGAYETTGDLCVPQAVYQAICHSGALAPKTLRKMPSLDNEKKTGLLTGHPNVKVNLSLLYKTAVSNGGVGLSSIRKAFSAQGSKSLHMWTVERPDGKFYPYSRVQKGDVHIVIAHAHAYAVVPRDSAPGLPPAMDCKQ